MSRHAARISRDPSEFLESYRRSRISREWDRVFRRFDADHRVRLKYPKEHDDPARQGDLIVLKPYVSPREKGVLLIQYDESVCKVATHFQLRKMAKEYRFVVEPSTWGYYNPFFFLLYGIGTDVVFQAQYAGDFAYIQSLGGNFHASRLGAGDWVDPDLFQPGATEDKVYDLVMVANWLSFKRHGLLFQALKPIRNRVNKVALVGYPIGGRTREDVLREAKEHGLEDKVVLFERISPQEVALVLRASRFGILLSRKEGANRGIYECFFSNVPVLLSDSNMGVNRDHVNPQTGVIVPDNSLTDGIARMLDTYSSFTPRNWAEQNTGFGRSTGVLNSQLRDLALRSGELWNGDIFTKKNIPHVRYADALQAREADREYERLKQYLRG